MESLAVSKLNFDALVGHFESMIQQAYETLDISHCEAEAAARYALAAVVRRWRKEDGNLDWLQVRPLSEREV